MKETIKKFLGMIERYDELDSMQERPHSPNPCLTNEQKEINRQLYAEKQSILEELGLSDSCLESLGGADMTDVYLDAIESVLRKALDVNSP
jgi:primosomal protein N'